jgi:hypothetical protein
MTGHCHRTGRGQLAHSSSQRPGDSKREWQQPARGVVNSHGGTPFGLSSWRDLWQGASADVSQHGVTVAAKPGPFAHGELRSLTGPAARAAHKIAVAKPWPRTGVQSRMRYGVGVSSGTAGLDTLGEAATPVSRGPPTKRRGPARPDGDTSAATRRPATILVVKPRHRRAFEVGPSARPCGLCGSADVVLMQTRAVRHGAAWLNPRFDPAPRTHELCRSCGAKHRTQNGLRL